MSEQYEDVYVCTDECFYGDHDYAPGDLVLEHNGAVRHMPELFEKLAKDDRRVAEFFRTRQVMRQRVEELDRQEIAEERQKRRAHIANARVSEERFWSETGELLDRASIPDPDSLPDPAAEEELEQRRAEQRIAALPADEELFLGLNRRLPPARRCRESLPA